MFGHPDVYGLTEDGFCGHAGCRPDRHIPNDYGLFCADCFRWLIWHGPARRWGDGMHGTNPLNNNEGET